MTEFDVANSDMHIGITQERVRETPTMNGTYANSPQSADQVTALLVLVSPRDFEGSIIRPCVYNSTADGSLTPILNEYGNRLSEDGNSIGAKDFIRNVAISGNSSIYKMVTVSENTGVEISRDAFDNQWSFILVINKPRNSVLRQLGSDTTSNKDAREVYTGFLNGNSMPSKSAVSGQWLIADDILLNFTHISMFNAGPTGGMSRSGQQFGSTAINCMVDNNIINDVIAGGMRPVEQPASQNANVNTNPDIYSLDAETYNGLSQTTASFNKLNYAHNRLSSDAAQLGFDEMSKLNCIYNNSTDTLTQRVARNPMVVNTKLNNCYEKLVQVLEGTRVASNGDMDMYGDGYAAPDILSSDYSICANATEVETNVDQALNNRSNSSTTTIGVNQVYGADNPIVADNGHMTINELQRTLSDRNILLNCTVISAPAGHNFEVADGKANTPQNICNSLVSSALPSMMSSNGLVDISFSYDSDAIDQSVNRLGLFQWYVVNPVFSIEPGRLAMIITKLAGDLRDTIFDMIKATFGSFSINVYSSTANDTLISIQLRDSMITDNGSAIYTQPNIFGVANSSCFGTMGNVTENIGALSNIINVINRRRMDNLKTSYPVAGDDIGGFRFDGMSQF